MAARFQKAALMAARLQKALSWSITTQYGGRTTRFERKNVTTSIFRRAAAASMAALLLAVGARADDFPPELTHFVPAANNPVFTAEGPGHWDVKMRERGWILHEGPTWDLWFTGYDGTRNGLKMLGYATSADGLRWTRDPAIRFIAGTGWRT